MKIVETVLYLEFNELVECGVSARTITDAKDKGYNCWRFIDDPTDKRKVLVDYEGLKDVYKKMVLERFGNPYDRVARMPILRMVELDFKANEYYKQYRFTTSPSGYSSLKEGGDERYLPIDTVNKYTRAASWLNMLNKVGDNKKEIKKTLGLSLSEFFMHTSELIGVEKKRGKLEGYAGLDVLPGDFPGSYQRLTAKAAAFAEAMAANGTQGYDYLIDPLYGNKHAAKIGKVNVGNEVASSLAMTVNDGNCTEIAVVNGTKSNNKRGVFDPELERKQMAVIRAIATKHNNFDAGQVAELANTLFKLNGWNTLSVGRIRQIMDEIKHVLTPGRQGKKKYMSSVAMQVTRKATDMPMKYWTLDGWMVELLYQVKGKKGMDYKRLVVVVVLDAMNKYPVGYAIGERETADLIREANRNAILHMKELFGEYYRPWQVQSDNYQIKNLTPYYQAMSHLHTPAAVGNAKAKIIEPYFMMLNKKYCQKKVNWSGFNVTANRDNQVNTEYLDKIKHSLPDMAGVVKQINGIMERERAAKAAEYTSKWPLYEANGGRPEIMTDMEWLEVFGRELGDRTSRINGQGLEKTVNGVKYLYDSFDPAFRAHMHINWTISGDEMDMSRVLATSPDGKMKFVLEHKRILPMDVRSSSSEDHAYRAKITHFNNDRIAEIIQQYGSDADIARQVVLDTPLNLSNEDELDLKLMLTVNGQQKERIQTAKGLVAVQKKEQKALMQAEMAGVNEFQEARFQLLTEGLDLDEYARP